MESRWRREDLIRERIVKETGRQRGREGFMTNCRSTIPEKKDITRKRRNGRRKDGGGEGWEGSPHKIIRQEPERPQMQNTRDRTQMKEREDKKQPGAEPNEGVVAWAPHAIV